MQVPTSPSPPPGIDLEAPAEAAVSEAAVSEAAVSELGASGVVMLPTVGFAANRSGFVFKLMNDLY